MPNTTASKSLSSREDDLDDLSERLFKTPPKKVKSKTKFEIIQKLEPAINSLIESGHSYLDICEILNNELKLNINVKTIRIYLNKIEKEREVLISHDVAEDLSESKSSQPFSSISTDLSEVSKSKSESLPFPVITESPSTVNSDLPISDLPVSVVPKINQPNKSSTIKTPINTESNTGEVSTPLKKTKTNKPIVPVSVVSKLVPPIENISNAVESVDSLPIDNSSNNVQSFNSVHGNSIPIDEDPRYSHLTPAEKDMMKHYNRY